jgi:hypothetical protein
MNMDSDTHPQFPFFKGLQKPLEFMGIQGRYIYWAAGAVGGAILGFILGYCGMGFLCGMLLALASLAAGALLIALRQRQGLHTKKSDEGVFIYAQLRKL